MSGDLVSALARGKTLAELMAERRWMERAACNGHPTDLWFTEPRHPQFRERTATAKAICARCEVRDECRAYAVANRETYGIWGGDWIHKVTRPRRR